MSPPGKRRHNELNAAPLPENPQGTGATDDGSDGDGVHSGKCFGIRAETHQSAIRAARFHRAVLGFPFEGCEAGSWFPPGTNSIPRPCFAALGGEAKEDVRGRTFNSPRFDLSALCDLYPILPADTPCGCGVATLSGGQGGIPLAALSFLSFSFSGERKTDWL